MTLSTAAALGGDRIYPLDEIAKARPVRRDGRKKGNVVVRIGSTIAQTHGATGPRAQKGTGR